VPRRRRRAQSLARDAFNWFYGELYRTTTAGAGTLYPGYEHMHEMGRFRRLLKTGVNSGSRLRRPDVVGTRRNA